MTQTTESDTENTRAAAATATAAGARAATVAPSATGLGPKPVEEQSIGELVASASREASALMRKEIELVKLDLATTAKRAAIGGGALSMAAVVMLLAAILVSFAIVFGIHALGLTLGWSFLVVGGAYVLAAGMMAGIGGLALRRAKPARSPAVAVKADIAALRGQSVGES